MAYLEVSFFQPVMTISANKGCFPECNKQYNMRKCTAYMSIHEHTHTHTHTRTHTHTHNTQHMHTTHKKCMEKVIPCNAMSCGVWETCLLSTVCMHSKLSLLYRVHIHSACTIYYIILTTFQTVLHKDMQLYRCRVCWVNEIYHDIGHLNTNMLIVDVSHESKLFRF